MHVFGLRAPQKSYPNVIVGILVLVVVKSSGAKTAFDAYRTSAHELFIHFSVFDGVDHFLTGMVVDFSAVAADHVELRMNFGQTASITLKLLACVSRAPVRFNAPYGYQNSRKINDAYITCCLKKTFSIDLRAYHHFLTSIINYA